jgi:hypothetical protein
VDLWQHVWDRVQGKAPKGARRHKTWRKVRSSHILKHPRCAVCGLTTKLEVHHVIPFHIAPALELEPSNLLTLCENGKYGIRCHQLIGHLGSYQRVNPAAWSDAVAWSAKLHPPGADRGTGTRERSR